MPRTIWKFPLQVQARQTVCMPKGAKILSYAYNRASGLCLWAEVDPQQLQLAEAVNRNIFIIGTGHEVPIGAVFLGTAFLDDGTLVLHCYEVADVYL